jgi:hypothetical protein
VSRLVSLVLVLLLPACGLRRSSELETAVVGVYEARLPAADAAGRIVTLWIEPDAVATLDTVYVGKGRGPVLRGRWSVRDDELTVVLNGVEGGPQAPLVYTIEPERLVPKTWDHGLYGADGLPLRRR